MNLIRIQNKVIDADRIIDVDCGIYGSKVTLESFGGNRIVEFEGGKEDDLFAEFLTQKCSETYYEDEK